MVRATSTERDREKAEKATPPDTPTKPFLSLAQEISLTLYFPCILWYINIQCCACGWYAERGQGRTLTSTSGNGTWLIPSSCTTFIACDLYVHLNNKIDCRSIDIMSSFGIGSRLSKVTVELAAGIRIARCSQSVKPGAVFLACSRLQQVDQSHSLHTLSAHTPARSKSRLLQEYNNTSCNLVNFVVRNMSAETLPNPSNLIFRQVSRSSLSILLRSSNCQIIDLDSASRLAKNRI